MEQLTKLQLAKDFIELSVLMSHDKKFSPPIYDKNSKVQKLLYKAIGELKTDGIININLSTDGEMVITLNK